MIPIPLANLIGSLPFPTNGLVLGYSRLAGKRCFLLALNINSFPEKRRLRLIRKYGDISFAQSFPLFGLSRVNSAK